MTQFEVNNSNAVVTFYTHRLLMASFNILAIILLLVSLVSDFDVSNKAIMVTIAILFITMNTYKVKTIFNNTSSQITQHLYWLGLSFTRYFPMSTTGLVSLRFPEHFIYTIMLRLKTEESTFNVGDFMTEPELDRFVDKLLSITDIQYEKSL